MRKKSTSNDRPGVAFSVLFILWRGAEAKKEAFKSGRQYLVFFIVF